jgi:hypothetical protein
VKDEGLEEKPMVQISNHCSPAVRRKPSRVETVRESVEEYREVDILLGKIEGGREWRADCGKEDFLVRGSFAVRESLSMDPFL